MFNVVLYEPEIPPNTGNIIRLCANTGCRLHLVGPLGFSISDARLRRAGLDYHEFAKIEQYQSFTDFESRNRGAELVAFSTRGSRPYSDIRYREGEFLLFGPETRGLPQAVLEAVPLPRRARLPMRPHSRSLNLANSVAVVVYEAWRQLGFAGGA